ncbi:MAG: hypothetical protein ACKVPX_07560 [Myxococcaceae bacterium]
MKHLLVLDAANVMRRLEEHEEEMVRLFSRLRDRTPLIAPTRTWFDTITFGDLALLTPAEQRVANVFYSQLSELQWYLQYTEDMPGQVQRVLGQRLTALEVAHRALVHVLGPPTGEATRVVENRR